MKTIITILIILMMLINLYGNNLKTKSTVGKAWPELLVQENSTENYFINPNNFDFMVVGETCDILEKALKRYMIIIKLSAYSLIHDNLTQFNESTLIEEILVNLANPCENHPHLNMDEWYHLDGAKQLISNSIWGILRGLETFSQLLTPTIYGMLRISNFQINDSPRFPHRGLMLDTARHYIKIHTILTLLDGMAYNKLNVFHWHIVDDESFPYQSVKFPELSEKGAYKPSMIYTIENISNIIEYARLRGIRVIADFNVPGHTRSWGNSHPELLTECESLNKKLGPINPISDTSYKFLHDLFSEVLNIFKDKFMHVGGNQIDCDCWKSNKRISNYIAQHNLTCEHLQKVYIDNVTRILTEKSFSAIAWQDVIADNILMPKETIVQVWHGDWRKLLKNISSSERRVILSECWYNFSSDNNWENDYDCDPHDYNFTVNERKFLIGGEACIWTNDYGDSNVLQNIFPRISAMAEKLWSEKKIRNITDVKQRLEEHTCRMILRGIPAKPLSGAGIC